MEHCSSKKKSYYTADEAEEALIRSNIRFHKPAVSYYLCEICAQFHLTSRGETHPLLLKPEVIARIKKEQQFQDWSARLKNK